MANIDKRSFLTIIALWAAGIVAAGQFAKLAVIFPQIAAIYPDAGSAIGLVVTLLSFLGIGFGLVAGILAARIGFRRLLLSALLLGAGMSLFQAAFPPLWIFLISRLIEGASHLAIVVAAPTLIAQIAPDRFRPAAMTLWGTFFGVAFALAAWLGLPLVSVFGPSVLLFSHAGIALLVALILSLILPRRNPYGAASQSRLTLRRVFDQHLEVYRSAKMSAPAFGWLFYTLTFVSLLTVLPGTVTPDERIFVAATMPLAGIAVSMTVGVFALRYVPATQVIYLGFSCSVVLAILLAAFPGNPMICIALMGALGLVQGASFAAVPQLNTDTKSQALANGAMAQMGNLGNTLGIPIILGTTAMAGFTGVMVFLVTCFVLGICVHLHLSRNRASRLFD